MVSSKAQKACSDSPSSLLIYLHTSSLKPCPNYIEVSFINLFLQSSLPWAKSSYFIIVTKMLIRILQKATEADLLRISKVRAPTWKFLTRILQTIQFLFCDTPGPNPHISL
eukprot:TRINITY_DN24041_c0_g1_i1.p1 TRINITY_DN24041_c0_g1~~TRINITY_DN24041_c0_g1_i1.p1  ORF type:complete len:111 (-),score=4.32 TRINITY_DN24041_c0_g1_i1:161-493(-)